MTLVFAPAVVARFAFLLALPTSLSSTHPLGARLLFPAFFPQRFRFGRVTDQSLASITWERSLSLLHSPFLQKVMYYHALATDPASDTLEDFHPLTFSANSPDADLPTWNEAMNGPLREGFEGAMRVEVTTLEGMDSWDVVV